MPVKQVWTRLKRSQWRGKMHRNKPRYNLSNYPTAMQRIHLLSSCRYNGEYAHSLTSLVSYLAILRLVKSYVRHFHCWTLQEKLLGCERLKLAISLPTKLVLIFQIIYFLTTNSWFVNIDSIEYVCRIERRECIYLISKKK